MVVQLDPSRRVVDAVRRRERNRIDPDQPKGRKGPPMKEHLRDLVRSTGGPIAVAIVITSLVAIIGWKYTREQLGGRAPSRRAGGFGIGGLTVAVLGLAVARVVLLR